MPLRRPKMSVVGPQPSRIYTEEEIQQRIADLPFSLQLISLNVMENLLQREIRESLTSLTSARKEMQQLQSHVNGLVVEGFQEGETYRQQAAAATADATKLEASTGDEAEGGAQPPPAVGNESTKPKVSGAGNNESTKPKAAAAESPKEKQQQQKTSQPQKQPQQQQQKQQKQQQQQQKQQKQQQPSQQQMQQQQQQQIPLQSKITIQDEVDGKTSEV